MACAWTAIVGSYDMNGIEYYRISFNRAESPASSELYFVVYSSNQIRAGA